LRQARRFVEATGKQAPGSRRIVESIRCRTLSASRFGHTLHIESGVDHFDYMPMYTVYRQDLMACNCGRKLLGSKSALIRCDGVAVTLLLVEFVTNRRVSQ
jgi:hypothetical protein